MKFGDAALEPEGREAKLFARLVHDLVTNQGFGLPLHLITLNYATGAMTLGRWDAQGEQGTFTPIAYHIPPEGVGLETSMCVWAVDTKGRGFVISVPNMVKKYLGAEEEPPA